MTVDRPEFRISDAEREEAIDALGAHMRDGRLNIDEYGDRTAQATAAKTRGELITLFHDLPEPRPAMLREQLPAPPEQELSERGRRRERPERSRRREPSRRRAGLPVGVVPIAVAVAIGLVLLLRIPVPLLLIPIVLVIVGACGRRWPGRG